MIKYDSRIEAVEEKQVIYNTSAPTDSEWGQPAASYYSFNIVDNMMFGRLIVGTYVSSSSADILPIEPTLATEFEIWDALSDEALDNFEATLE
ncbi:MAG: hypothetical protein HYR94_04955 [Chloroflexi bacterium]|nr:hypothetical protein [Chloroflexota bacterium]